MHTEYVHIHTQHVHMRTGREMQHQAKHSCAPGFAGRPVDLLAVSRAAPGQRPCNAAPMKDAPAHQEDICIGLQIDNIVCPVIFILKLSGLFVLSYRFSNRFVVLSFHNDPVIHFLHTTTASTPSLNCVDPHCASLV
jgi:hypothetical protein